ncbi:hypothetical protein EVAR_53087_1 [Eumeta japonica]|uniref:RNA-directed DNA polymerase from mobile element jockey n=1 Tax=Eumeta variegata TaxID=151549 RepID=A0A4C1Z1J7_EUMVA|nr:hypothetical protein EVAR_53087_1 [Eumeta japonica]
MIFGQPAASSARTIGNSDNGVPLSAILTEGCRAPAPDLAHGPYGRVIVRHRPPPPARTECHLVPYKMCVPIMNGIGAWHWPPQTTRQRTVWAALQASLETLHLESSFATATDVDNVVNQLRLNLWTPHLLPSRGSIYIPSRTTQDYATSAKKESFWTRCYIDDSAETSRVAMNGCSTVYSTPITTPKPGKGGVAQWPSAQTTGYPAAARSYIVSFLHQRSFCVAVNEALSAPRPIRAGVLQDWEDDVMLAMYANDSTYFASFRRVDLAARKIQRVFDVLPDRLDKWRMTVNVGKPTALLTASQRIMSAQLRLRA